MDSSGWNKWLAFLRNWRSWRSRSLECKNHYKPKLSWMLGNEVPLPSQHMAGRSDIKLVKGSWTWEDFVWLRSHESRRIDNQLRGRSGRQGDPGSHNSPTLLKMDETVFFGFWMAEGILNVSTCPKRPVSLVCWRVRLKQLRSVSKEITTILVNKSFNTMMSCVNKRSTLQRYDVITADRDAPEIQAMDQRTIERVVDSCACQTRWKTKFWTC